MLKLAFDIGGTFTDLVMYDDQSGKAYVCKVPTTPKVPEKAVIEGIKTLLAESGAAGKRIESVFHATTIATNAILERKGCDTALITTAGFRDVILIGRQKRYDTHDLYLDKPEPLIRRRNIVEVVERIDARGAIVEPLDRDSVDKAIDDIVASGAESVAISLLHCYANPRHEEAVAERIKARAPGLDVSVSSRVSGKYREYERTNTTVANAYVKPIVSRYLKRLEDSLGDLGIEAPIYIMQSNGGVVSPELAVEYPVRIVESGPAAGVLMCANVAKQEGFEHVITFDMGGTTAKLGAVDHGEPDIAPTFEVDARNYRRFSGLPLNVSSIELLEIGSGGGSIASVGTGLIHVGPRSAGAEPGPICYKRGGDRPTVTDANLVLGYLNPDNFNGGAMTLDVDGAAEGIRRVVAEPLDIEMEQAAWGIHAVANSHMETAMRVISVEKGRDPRKYAMVAFGGAGPLHAARLARALGVPKVIVPQAAGVGSAMGLLTAQTRIDVSLTRILRLESATAETIASVFAELEGRARSELEHLRGATGLKWKRYAYMRYHGQGFEIMVPLPRGDIDESFVAASIDAFHQEYMRNYGYRDDGAVVEGVDWQLVAEFPNSSSLTLSVGAGDGDGGSAVVGTRQAYFGEAGGYVACKVIDRYKMKIGEKIPGPAIVEERESSTVILPGDVASISDHGNLIIDIAGE